MNLDTEPNTLNERNTPEITGTRNMSDLMAHAPRFSESEAADLARRLFDVNAQAMTLPSERDQNFRLKDEKGDRFVLKIANATESREVLKLQNLTMTHLIESGRGLFDEFDPCPRVCHAPGERTFSPSTEAAMPVIS